MRVKHPSRSKRKFLSVFLVLLILIIGTIVFIQWRVSPVVCSVASVQAKSFAVTAINKAAAEVLEKNDLHPLESVTASGDGTLKSLSTNTAEANKLKHLITLKAQESLSNLNHEKINVPVGMIVGGELFGAVGPEIPVYISLSGNTESDFEESFESGGINQTVHKLSLVIRADIRVLTPSGTLSETVSTSVLIGETVIVGNTPNGMFDIN